MVVASAPGKVILFGEHAVVYGKPALVGAIDRRIYVRATQRQDSKIKVFSGDLTPKSIAFRLEEIGGRATDDYRYVRKAIEVAFDYSGKESGLELEITSDIPPASGLGSSAAVSVSTIFAILSLFGVDIEKEDLAKLGHRIEVEVQGAASPTDTAISTFGGVLFVQPQRKSVEKVTCSLPLIAGYTKETRSTAKLIETVKVLKELYPDIINPIIEDIGVLTEKAKKNLEDGESIGGLMNINHGLLEALGVSTEKLSALVHAARMAGAEGAKLTGAGGGGCMIAYAPKKQDEIVKAIEGRGGVAIKAPISQEGVRAES